MPTKKQEKKKKDRELRVREKMKNRRAYLLKIKKEDKLEDARITSLEFERGILPEKQTPYRRSIAKTPEEIREQLEHNIEILKALEDDYEKEMGQRRDLSGDALKALKQVEEKLQNLQGPKVSLPEEIDAD